MIICHPKTQLLTTLPMWQGGPLASFRVFFLKKKKKKKKEEEEEEEEKSKSKSCHECKVFKSCVLKYVWQCIISSFFFFLREWVL